MKVALIFCRGRSGSYYLHSLLDGHSQILSIPPASSLRYFFHTTDRFWFDGGMPKLGRTEMVEAFISENPAIFDARGKSRGLGFDKMGRNRDEYIHSAVETFRRELTGELANGGEMFTRRDFFIAAHIVYQRTLSTTLGGNEELIVYQIHNPLDDRGIREMMVDFPEAVAIGVASDPIRSFVSFLFLLEPNLMSDATKACEVIRTATYLYCYRMVVEGWDGFRSHFPNNNFRAQSLQKLHQSPEQVTRDLADWLRIKWEPCLLASTFNNMMWNGDRWSILTSGASNADQDIPRKRADAVMSAHDKRVLTELYRPTAKEIGAVPAKSLGKIRTAIYIALPTKLERTAMLQLARSFRWRDVLKCGYFWLRRTLISYAYLWRPPARG